MNRDVGIWLSLYALWFVGLFFLPDFIDWDWFNLYLSLPILAPLAAIGLLYGLAALLRLFEDRRR